MAKRVTPEQVAKVIRDYDEDIDFDPFIEMANILTNRVAAKDVGSLLNSDELAMIEKWLAAHFYETRDHEISEETTEQSEGKYAGQFGKGLERTRAGQNAMLFDETGYLRKVNEGVTLARVEWLGKVPSNQTDYVDRD